MAQMKTVTKWPYWVTQHGNEILLHDEDFKSHSVLDWYTDVGVNSFLSAPDWLRTILRQVPPVHVPHILMSQPRAHLAHMLCGIHDMDEVFFSNDGTEAVETTIKLARKWHYDQHSEKVYCHRIIMMVLGQRCQILSHSRELKTLILRWLKQ